jgi:hypothetical protein
MSVVRAPRCVVSVNGASIAVLEASVHVSVRQSADTFYCKLPLDNSAGLDETFWADTAPIPVSVLGTNNIATGSYKTLLIGQVDRPQITLHDRVVAIEGRDLTASLTDSSSTTEQFKNQNDEEVIRALAGRVGLTVQFAADPDAPPTKTGLQYDQDFNLASSLDTPWNVIVALARKSGRIAFIKGTVLYVQPIDADTTGVFKVNYQRPQPGVPASSDAVMLTCSRDLNIAKTLQVEHQSWQHKQGKSITSKFQSKSSSKDTAILRFRGANLTKEQQDRVAKSRLRETMTHERQINIDMPGDVTADPLNELQLTGTGTEFDQGYLFTDIIHRFDRTGGYQMTINAHSADDARGEPEQLQ